MKSPAFVSSLFALFSLPLWVRETVTLDVPVATCAACPITVKTALNRVEGVRQVDVSFERREARVTFEDTQTSVATLIEATANAGYPSTSNKARRIRSTRL